MPFPPQPPAPTLACQAYHSANQSIGHNTPTTLSFDSDRYDSNAMHYTSSSNLTGTVSKAASSATLTGSGTAFTTELSVGQIIDVPGTATERRVVTAIASDTSLTVNANYANTASGQTAVRVNQGVVIRTPGLYLVLAAVRWEANAAGVRLATIYRVRAGDAGTPIGAATQINNSTTQVQHTVPVLLDFNQWDYLEVRVTQTSGGALNAEVLNDSACVLSAVRVGDV